jgi:hypothetical protein
MRKLRVETEVVKAIFHKWRCVNCQRDIDFCCECGCNLKEEAKYMICVVDPDTSRTYHFCSNDCLSIFIARIKDDFEKLMDKSDVGVEEL